MEWADSRLLPGFIPTRSPGWPATYLADPEADLTDVERVVVAANALLPKVRVDEIRILPGAREAAVVEENVTLERIVSEEEGAIKNCMVLLNISRVPRHRSLADDERLRLSSWLASLTFLNSRSLPFFSSCLIGVPASSVAISYCG